MTTYLVTGASGVLGKRVLELLLQRGASHIIAASRTRFEMKGVQVRHADFDQPETLKAAFAGADRALLISTDAIMQPGQRARQHEAAIAALAESSVAHVVYTSLTNATKTQFALAADHALTEALLQQSGLSFVALRNQIYMHMLLQSLPPALASGRIVDARGSGKISWVTREDCAQAAAAALWEGDTHTGIVDITGPQALSSAELAAIVTEVIGRPVRHEQASPQGMLEAMVSQGMPQAQAALFATFDAAIAHDELSVVTDGVAQLTGSAAVSVREFLAAHRSVLA